ncbi:hypothetical protein [Thermogemmatispora sp.]|uniref:hypothetical protein n=1 Tax=Thermogemmatispora sp. TaxID=1968838 RepID=UPI001DF975BB|nr:hypothetical protein [Thermogemmatispora sp.]MBX5450411.1 hypothetical protein [Thermogemmatispora sp.]
MQTLSTTLPPQLVLAGSTLYASQGGVYGLDTATGQVRRQYAVSNGKPAKGSRSWVSLIVGLAGKRNRSMDHT